jgi:myo-inositol-1(or 4)-monophosphatase
MRQAGDIALQQFRAAPAIEDKGGGGGFDPVTEADRMTERFLRRELSARYPAARIVGEEGGATGPPGPTQWVIDPIDGTRAYITGVPMWGVLLGLVVDGRPVAGWCRQPYLDETFAAVDGRGWLDHAGRRCDLHTGSTTDLAEASMYSTHPSMFTSPWARAAFESLAGRVRLQRFGGDCYSYCLLALGAIDLVVEADLQPYDIVPLIPIVEAAGGVVTGPQGQTPLAGGFVVAAATPELHARAMECLAPA